MITGYTAGFEPVILHRSGPSSTVTKTKHLRAQPVRFHAKTYKKHYGARYVIDKMLRRAGREKMQNIYALVAIYTMVHTPLSNNALANRREM